MTNSIFSKVGNGNISYRRYFNGWRNGTLKNRLTIERAGQSLVFHMLDGDDLRISVDRGNNVFDQSDYHQGLGERIGFLEPTMDFGGQHYSYYLQQAKQYDQSLGGPNRYDNDPTIDSYDNGPIYSAIRGQFIEFLDARDGMLDGEITDATMKEFRSKANAGTSYTQADFSEVKKLIDTEKVSP